MREAGYEIACHGLRWIDYQDVTRETERRTGRAPSRSTPRSPASARSAGTPAALAQHRGSSVEDGGFLYDSDAYDDDLPYWARASTAAALIVPYTLDTNDMRFATPQGFNTGDQFFAYLKDSFDVLYAEGEAGAPR